MQNPTPTFLHDTYQYHADLELSDATDKLLYIQPS